MSLQESQNTIIQDDVQCVAKKFADQAKIFANKSVLITGATGLVGKHLVLSLLSLARLNRINLVVIAQGRSLGKLEQTFQDVTNNKNLYLWQTNLFEKLDPPCSVNYVIHAACPTSSKDFIEKPIGVIDSIYQSTLNILDLCSSQRVESCVYLSSMEVYGQMTLDKPISESDCGQLDILSPRSSYPQAKRIAELLCSSFAKEKNVPVKIARLSMVYGPGMPKNDKRVLNYFVNQIINKQEIALQTAGKSKASVLYTRDAVEGIITLLLSTRNAEAFNLANPNNYYSILEMANIASSIGSVPVTIEKSECQQIAQYRNDNFLNLNISKMNELGWFPNVTLEKVFLRTVLSHSNKSKGEL